MVVVAQLVRVLVCGAEGRRFEPGQPPKNAKVPIKLGLFFVFIKGLFLYSASFLSTTNLFSRLAISQTMAKANWVLLVKASNSILLTSSVAL